MPTNRNGSKSNHAIGYNTSAMMASGQQRTSRMNQSRNFIVNPFPQKLFAPSIGTDPRPATHIEYAASRGNQHLLSDESRKAAPEAGKIGDQMDASPKEFLAVTSKKYLPPPAQSFAMLSRKRNIPGSGVVNE